MQHQSTVAIWTTCNASQSDMEYFWLLLRLGTQQPKPQTASSSKVDPEGPLTAVIHTEKCLDTLTAQKLNAHH